MYKDDWHMIEPRRVIILCYGSATRPMIQNLRSSEDDPQFCCFGAENETRTRDPNLGKVMLYQLSYFRIVTPFISFGIAKVRTFFKLPNFFEKILQKMMIFFISGVFFAEFGVIRWGR